jgi:hypothetical protein
VNLLDVIQEIGQALQEVFVLWPHVTIHIQGYSSHGWYRPLSEANKYLGEQENTL